MNSKKETIIISLGGSLVAPNEIDLGFLKSFKYSLQKYLGTRRFFIIVGGGKIARLYQKALLEFGAKSADRDWIGIDITRLNARIIKQIFSGNCYPEIITDPNKKIKTNKDIAVGAGWKPGWSTDYMAVMMAKKYNEKIPTRGSRIHDAHDSSRGIGTIINLTNIDYVYDKDPSKFSDAKTLEKVDWKTFRQIVGDKWSPGLNVPFDPTASKLAQKLKIKVIMINGKKLERLEDFLNNKPFIGTTIK